MWALGRDKVCRKKVPVLWVLEKISLDFFAVSGLFTSECVFSHWINLGLRAKSVFE